MDKRNLIIQGSNCCEDFEWEDLTSELTALMKKRNPSGIWFASVSNFGWRGTSGEKTFRATTGEGLLSAILPDTECSFKIYKYGRKGFAINNSHHDSPCGAEWYYIVPSDDEEAKVSKAERVREEYKKVAIYGSRDQINEVKKYLDTITLSGNESQDRLLLQEKIMPLMDKPHLKDADILYDGNGVYSFNRIVSQFRKLIQDYSYENFTDELYEFLHLCCGSIAHYNKHGWFSQYSSLGDLREFFKRNEYGQDVLSNQPYWATDRRKIVEKVNQLLGLKRQGIRG